MSKLGLGPWKWDGEFPIMIVDAEGYFVVGPGGMMPSGEANARLIASAPELLEALKAAYRSGLPEAEYVLASKAIAKAEGRD